MLEKLAPTWLAGMPAIVKPASQTAYLTELMVRRIIATGLLPAGALQLISGSVGDLLDHVGAQDVVTFTGSAATGRTLRAHPAVIEHATRFTMEADSLNCAVLGSDAHPDTPEFDLFVREVAREMVTKCGQKCTAIRRVIVPRRHADALIAALGARLGETAVGDPRDEAVRMGPLASLAQREEVHSRIGELAAEAEIVVGDPARSTLVSGDAEAGAFLNPVLLYCDAAATRHRRARDRGLRPGGDRHALRDDGGGGGARPSRGGGGGGGRRQSRRLGVHRRPGVRPRRGHRHRPRGTGA